MVVRQISFAKNFRVIKRALTPGYKVQSVAPLKN